VYRVTGGEREVYEALDAMWGKPGEASGVLVERGSKNQDLYKFEKMIEG
jgi:hypothetical protein